MRVWGVRLGMRGRSCFAGNVCRGKDETVNDQQQVSGH